MPRLSRGLKTHVIRTEMDSQPPTEPGQRLKPATCEFPANKITKSMKPNPTNHQITRITFFLRTRLAIKNKNMKRELQDCLKLGGEISYICYPHILVMPKGPTNLHVQ